MTNRSFLLSVLFILILVTRFTFTAYGEASNPLHAGDAVRFDFKFDYSQGFKSLRLCIEDLGKTFPQKYTGGAGFLKELDELEKELPEVVRAFDSPDTSGFYRIDEFIRRFTVFKRKALTANPLVKGTPILFVVRKQYKPDHHNTATIFQTGEVDTENFAGGGAMKLIDFADNGKVKTLIDSPYGIIRDPEVSFDAKKIVFSMRRDISDDYHIYEINSDGTGLKQLTCAPGVSDIDPFYLPDNSIAFSSSREPKYSMFNKHIMVNLFKMEGDGANIHQIGKSTLFEGHGSLMPDGRILYDRWEHVDRNFGDAQGLWTVYPDGTNHALYWGNNTNSPGGVIDARCIPETHTAICIFSSCHDRPWGALAIIDRRYGLDGREPVVRTWPPDAIDIVGKGDWDAFTVVNPKYEDPFPLSDRYFLCSRTTGEEEQMGIYLIDVFGNEILLHTEKPGCFDPMPLIPRPRPLSIPSRRNYKNDDGHLYVVNVYNGTHMEGVKRGDVKYLRVIESPEKQNWNYNPWSGQDTGWPAMNWDDFCNKQILGIVPVEEDGSAYFSIPSDTFVYFQLLDDNGMMIQSMRSGTIVQSGETTGCLGCHDNRRTTSPPAKTKMPLSLEKEPNTMQGWYGEPRFFNYIREVQPVFDRHCIRCHDYGKPAGEKLNLAGDRTLTFNVSYEELWIKKIINVIGAGPAEIQQAYTWGSHTSKLIDVILQGHNGIVLDKESFDRLVTWIDLNAPYYPVYSTAYPDNLAGRSPLDNDRLQRLTELTGVPFANLARRDRQTDPHINFDRPEMSLCLSNIKDRNSPAFLEALSIIRAGQNNLNERPRADMDGFIPCEADRLRQEKYEIRRQIELRNREAILNGEKVYDTCVK